MGISPCAMHNWCSAKFSCEGCSLMQSWLANAKQIISLQSEPPPPPDLRFSPEHFTEVKTHMGLSQKQNYTVHNNLLILLRILLQFATQDPQCPWQLICKCTIYWGLWHFAPDINKLWKLALWKQMLNWASSSIISQLFYLVLVGDYNLHWTPREDKLTTSIKL